MEEQNLKEKDQDSDIEILENKIDNSNEKKKKEFIFEMALFLILGILVGITIKNEAIKKITIGFNDYHIIPMKNGYNIESIKKNLEKEAKEIQDAQSAAIKAQENK